MPSNYQGSVVTYVRSGGIFVCVFVTNLVLNFTVNNYENWSAYGEVIGESILASF